MSSRKARKGDRSADLTLGTRSPILPVNCEDQKQRFFNEGKLPEFVLRGSYEEVKKLTSLEKAVVKFEYLENAERILNIVRKKYGDAKTFLDVTYGPEITRQKATKAVADYIHNNGIEGHMSVNWCSELACSATMMWQGPALKYNRPEARRYSLWLSDSKANTFLREKGIVSLLHHEIGTHYFRMHNDGLQPWFSDRKRFQLQSMSSRKLGETEEGLASIHTVLDSKIKFLWTGALLYYAACKAVDMSFRELFDHLERYVEDKDQRWKHCLRVKRGLHNVNVPGGYGKDQCYFEGAVKLLQNIDKIDFVVLMAGKICYDEVDRVKRLARTDIIKLPHFMQNTEKYKRRLREIARINCLAPEKIPRSVNSVKSVRERKEKIMKPQIRTPCPKDPLPGRIESPKPVDNERRISSPRSVCSDVSPRTPQFFRYTHTPTHSSSSPVSPHNSTSSINQETGNRGTFIEAGTEADKFVSSPNVRQASAPSRRPKTARAHSMCATDALQMPEIKHYSERMLHRKSVKRSKTSTRRKKKRTAVKSERPVVVEIQPSDSSQSQSDAEDLQRFGCLRTNSQNEEEPIPKHIM